MRLVQAGLKELGGMSSGMHLADVTQVVFPGAESRAGWMSICRCSGGGQCGAVWVQFDARGCGWHGIWRQVNQGRIDGDGPLEWDMSGSVCHAVCLWFDESRCDWHGVNRCEVVGVNFDKSGCCWSRIDE